MDNQQAKSEFDKGWLVGFLEGEGCFALQKNKCKGHKAWIVPRISMSGADFELVERAGGILIQMGVGTYFTRKRYTTKQDQLEIVVSGLKRCKTFLDKLVPLMTDSRKRRCAETLLEYCTYRLQQPKTSQYTEVEFGMWQTLRDLNGYKLKQSLRDSTRDIFNYDMKVESNAT